MEYIKRYLHNTDMYLMENGISNMTGFDIRWWLYIPFKVFFSLFLTLVIYEIFNLQIYVILPMSVVLFFTPDYLIKMSNDNDNDDMLPDIKMIFDCLRIEVKAGVYISDAISQIMTGINNKRLRAGMKYLIERIAITNDIDTSLSNFNEMFNNRHIDTLVVILRQAMVSGQSGESLDNAFAQMTDIEQAINIKIENSLERKITVIQVMVFLGIILLAGFCCLSEFKGLFVSVK